MKNLFLTLVLSLVFIACGKEEEPKLSLGKVSFKSNATWIISNDDITQEWSDVVMATGCKKTSFTGGVYNEATEIWRYRADCRSNSDYGDLFSWEAVNLHKKALCPDNWRVPTMQDFIDLDIAMGGTGNLRFNVSDFIDSNYLDAGIWGGTRGGYCGYSGILFNQDSSAHYWSQSEYVIDNSHALVFGMDAVAPQGSGHKTFGFTLRCVR